MRLLTLLVVLAVPLAAARSAGTHVFQTPGPGTSPGVALPAIVPTAAPPSAHVLARDDHLRLTHKLSTKAATASAGTISASLTYDWISVFGFAPNSSVTMTIRSSPGGTVLATSTKTVSGNGGTNFLRGSAHDVDLVAGMQVTAGDGTSTKELTLAPLAVSSVDPATDVVVGTTAPGADVFVYVYSSTAYSPAYVVTADADGSWHLSFAGIFDVTNASAVSASVADTDGDQTNVYWRPALLSASITSDYFWVDGLAPAATVSYTIKQAPGGTTLASGSKVTDSTGWAAFYRGTDHAVDLRAGMLVSVSDGTTTKELMLAPLAITVVDAGNDTIAGTAPAGAAVEAYAYSPTGSGSPTKVTTAAGDGSWRVDFSGIFDIQPAGTANAAVHDSDGDATTVSKQPALLYAQLTGDWFDVTGFESNSALAYTLRSSRGGSVVATGTVTTDEWGGAYVTGAGDLVPGQQLTVTGGTVTKELTFADLTITSIDRTADAVSGTAPAGSDVEVNLYRSPSSYTLHATAGADGEWLADFTGSFDIDGGTVATALVRDSDGDATSIDRQPAVLQVSLTWQNAYLSGVTPNAPVTFTLRNAPGGAVLATGSETASGSGYASWYPPAGFAPGMELTTDDGSTTKALTVAALTIASIDTAGGTVSGTAAPGAHVIVYVRNSSMASPTRDVVADAAGTWTADFAGLLDLSSATALASIVDDDGDSTSVQRQAATIDASLMGGAISAYGFTPWTNATLTVRSSQGATVLGTRIAKTDGYGYVWFGTSRDHGVELAPGNEITVSDGTTTKVLTLADVSVDTVDVAADKVSGHAPAGSAVQVWVSNGSTSWEASATADGAGSWQTDVRGRYDIGWSTDATASVHDEDGDVTDARKLPTRLVALLTQDELALNGFVTHGTVTVTLRTSPTGSILYSGDVSADSYGSATVERATHGVDLVAGMYLTATDGTNTKDMTFASIRITGVDAVHDVVRGAAPAGAAVDVLANDASMHVTTGSDGTWLADYGGVYDIREGATAWAQTDDAETDITAVTWAPWLDTVPPTINAPSAAVADATSPIGGVVRFSVTASDEVDAAPTLSCSHDSGTWFAIGDTRINCTATDASGNQATASFVVHVRGAAEQLARLRSAVMHVGPGTSLADRVSAAANTLAAGNRVAARSILNAFVNQVRAQSGKTISGATATKLIADAQRIRDVIGG